MENMNTNKKLIEKVLSNYYPNFEGEETEYVKEWRKEEQRKAETAVATINEILSEEEIKNILIYGKKEAPRRLKDKMIDEWIKRDEMFNKTYDKVKDEIHLKFDYHVNGIVQQLKSKIEKYFYARKNEELRIFIDEELDSEGTPENPEELKKRINELPFTYIECLKEEMLEKLKI